MNQWILMGLTGLAVGILGFFLHQTIDLIADYKWKKAASVVREEGEKTESNG